LTIEIEAQKQILAKVKVQVSEAYKKTDMQQKKIDKQKALITKLQAYLQANI